MLHFSDAGALQAGSLCRGGGSGRAQQQRHLQHGEQLLHLADSLPALCLAVEGCAGALLHAGLRRRHLAASWLCIASSRACSCGRRGMRAPRSRRLRAATWLVSRPLRRTAVHDSDAAALRPEPAAAAVANELLAAAGDAAQPGLHLVLAQLPLHA